MCWLPQNLNNLIKCFHFYNYKKPRNKNKAIIIYDLTFSALVSLAEQRSHLSLSSSFLATHSSYFACRAAIPSSTSLSLALASFRIRRVSSRDSLASFNAAYEQKLILFYLKSRLERIGFLGVVYSTHS